MNVKTFVIGIAGFGMLASSASAAKTYDGPDGGDWSVPSNWSGDQLPSPTERAIIPTNYQVFFDADDEIGALTLQSGAELVIEDDRVLTLNGNGDTGSGYQHNLASGSRVVLANSNSTMLFIDEDQILSGAGQVEGQHDDAEIFIDDVRLENQSTIRGHLRIVGDGTAAFMQAGTVEAKNGTLEVAVSTDDDDYLSSLFWRIDAASAPATLMFSVQPAAMEGDFYSNDCDGVLDVRGLTVVTTGDLDGSYVGYVDSTGGSFTGAFFTSTNALDGVGCP